jgi:hypothetical protein
MQYRYLEYHSVCPVVGIGTPPPPLPQASVHPLPPEPKGGNALAYGRGGGVVPIRTGGEKVYRLFLHPTGRVDRVLYHSVYSVT